MHHQKAGGGWVLDDARSVEGTWEVKHVQWHINLLELLAVELSLKTFKQALHGQTVLIHSDNTTVCAHINKQGGTHAPELCLQTWQLFIWCFQHDVTLRAIYIPGWSNVNADNLSRGREHLAFQAYEVDHREWSLPQEVVDSVFLLLGHPQVDLFADCSNARLRHFCALRAGREKYP